MKVREWSVNFSVRFPKTVLAAALLVTVLFAAQFPKARIDTDPKHMLPETSEVRVYNDQVERQFSLHPDVIVLGIINERGLLNPDSLRCVGDITDKVLAMPGVITRDVLGLRTVDDVTVNGDQLGVRPLLADVPTNDAEVAALRKALFENPLLVGRFISADATTTAIYVPIEPTANGKQIADEIRRVVADYHGPERFYVAGDPVARDTFGGADVPANGRVFAGGGDGDVRGAVADVPQRGAGGGQYGRGHVERGVGDGRVDCVRLSGAYHEFNDSRVPDGHQHGHGSHLQRILFSFR